MRAVVFVLGVLSAFLIWRAAVHTPTPYAATVPIDRRPPLRIKIVERPQHAVP